MRKVSMMKVRFTYSFLQQTKCPPIRERSRIYFNCYFHYYSVFHAPFFWLLFDIACAIYWKNFIRQSIALLSKAFKSKYNFHWQCSYYVVVVFFCFFPLVQSPGHYAGSTMPRTRPSLFFERVFVQRLMYSTKIDERNSVVHFIIERAN